MNIFRIVATGASAAGGVATLFFLPGEPSTWALMILGIGTFGGALRLRRPVAEVAAPAV